MNTHNQVPTDWREFSLGDLLNFSNGINADKSAYGHGVPFANVLEVITHEVLKADDIPGLVRLPKQILSRYRVRRGDLLFNRTSETQDEVGLSSVYLDDAPIVFGGFVFRGRPTSSEMDVDFSKYVLRSQAVREQIIARGQGGIRANIGQRDLKSVRVQLPEHAEQRAIAAVLDDASRLIRRLEQAIAKKQAIKQGIMQQLLTGKTRLPGFTSNWCEVKLRDAGATYGGLTGKDKNDFGAGSASFVTFTEVMAGARLLGRRLERVRVRSGERQNQVQRGDVLFNGSSETPEEVALSAVVEFDPPPATYLNSFCFGYRLKDARLIDPTFLAYFFRADNGRELVASLAQGATRYNIAKTKLLEVQPALPPVDEQRAIVDVLRDAESEIEALGVRLTKARAVKTGMMQQLLTGRTRLPVGEVKG